MRYTHILVAVDTTDEAEQVVEAAREFAQDEDSAISFITVVKPFSDYYANLYSPLENDTGKRLEAEAVEHASARLSELAERYGINADTVNVVVGKPAVEIRRLAEELGADLIVVGTHGRHGVGLVLGSTANGVLHGAHCSVLAVKVRVEGSKIEVGLGDVASR